MSTAPSPLLFDDLPPARRVVLVTGLSGAGRSSILHMLEDLGYEAVDNPPLRLIEEVVTRGDRPAAIGIDTRSRGFDVGFVSTLLARLRLNPALRPELVFAFATDDVLIRRYTETRRRHPLAPGARVIDGIAAETRLLAPLKEAADMILDTTGLPLAALRPIVESRFGIAAADAAMTISLTSFAYPKGLPRDADLVFDMRFLRNPHYEPMLRLKTGLDPDVASYVEADPDFEPYLSKITDLLSLLLPRFVQEGKKYANIAVGCTGGRHRSVHAIQRLAAWFDGVGQDEAGLAGGGGKRTWRVVVNHRELSRAGAQDEHTRQAGATAQAAYPLPQYGGDMGRAASAAPRSAPEQGAVRDDSGSERTGNELGKVGLTMPAQAQEA